jgi:formate hydrogenlyase transcriptional activator
LQAENLILRENIDRSTGFEELVGASAGLKQVLAAIEKVAATDSTVLILGETGTGKELVAEAIHRKSRRGDNPMVKVNCAAVPESLIASELFGHERGAFTGAMQRRIGRFEMANHSSLFLDEVGELPHEMQVTLLRVLQEHEFERVGGNQPIRTDIRLIAATNRDLPRAIADNRFRSDLYYRLNVFPIHVPSLRERRDDIPILVEYFISRCSERMGKKIDQIDRPTMNLLTDYNWPGNIRELQNVIERAVILCSAEQIDVDLLSISESAERRSRPRIGDALSLEELERSHIRGVMANSSSLDHAAKILGIDVSTLYRKRKQYGL